MYRIADARKHEARTLNVISAATSAFTVLTPRDRSEVGVAP